MASWSWWRTGSRTVGRAGELVYDVRRGGPVVHDGVNPGGQPVAHVAFVSVAEMLAAPLAPRGPGALWVAGQRIYAERPEAGAGLDTAGGARLIPVQFERDGVLELRAAGGAVDGRTDDTLALQRALAMLAGGGTLEIGGTALLTGTVAVADLRGVTLVGGTILRREGQAGDARHPALRMERWQDCLVRDLVFDLGNDHTASRELALALDGCRGIEIAGCRFDNCYSGIWGTGGLSEGIRVSGCQGVSARSVHAAGQDGTRGGGAMVYGNARMRDVTVVECSGAGWNHLVLSGDCERWTVQDCHLSDSGDSAFYLRGSHHRIVGCTAERAGKDGIKILDFTDGTPGTGNVIEHCSILGGVGYTRRDGGKGINCETDSSQVTDCRVELALAPGLSLAAPRMRGVYVSGSGTRVSRITVTGAGEEAAFGLVVSANNSRQTRDILASGIRATGVGRAWVVNGRSSFGVSGVVLEDCQARGCGGLGLASHDYAQDEVPGPKITGLVIQGGGIHGSRGTALVLGFLADGVTVESLSFRDLAPGSYCIDHRDGTVGLYRDCSYDGSGAAPVVSHAGGRGRQEGNSWNRAQISEGPLRENFWFAGDRVDFSDAPARAAAGLQNEADGVGGTFRHLP